MASRLLAVLLRVASAAAFGRQRSVPLTMMAAESVTITLKGKTAASAFFANQCRREMTTFRGLAGTVAPGAEAESVVVTAEGERAQLESFARWCSRGPQDITLEGGAPEASVSYGAAAGLDGFSCAAELCAVELEAPAGAVSEAAVDGDGDDFNAIDEAELVAALISELSED